MPTPGRAAGSDTPWLTASAVGQAAYCPYQLYLAREGAARAEDADAALARGALAHEHWNAHHRAAARPRAVAVLRVALAIAIVAAVALVGWLYTGLPAPR